MKETILVILSYLANVIGVAGFAIIAKVLMKFIEKKIADFISIKNHLGFICKKLSESEEQNAKLKEQISALRMEIKGHKEK